MKLLGKVMGQRYVLQEVIGFGGMGIVYRARDLVDDRLVAVKVLRPELTGERLLVTRFHREATIAEELCHPNVMGILDHGEDGDRQYTVMELVTGDTLTTVMMDPLAGGEVIQILSQVLDGLAHAHELGLIHRDLKPDNIIVEHGRDGMVVKIVDFGVAIRHEQAASPGIDRLTDRDVAIGTPEFMAPEQATGEPIDHRIDLFALGVIAYALLAGTMPFDGHGMTVTLANMTLPVPSMRARSGVTVDPLLEAFTQWLLQKDRSARPSGAPEAKRVLDLIRRDPAAAKRLLRLHIEPSPRILAAVLGAPLPFDGVEPATLRMRRDRTPHPRVVSKPPR